MTGPAAAKRDFLRLTDLSRAELIELLERAAEWKLIGRRGPQPLSGRAVGLVFEKASTRTRVSFAVACSQLGASEMMLSPRDMQLGRGEPIRDTARVLSRYLDALVVRTYAHEKLEELARWASVPVVNALTDASHPCQVLADLLTVAERLGQDRVARGDLVVAWVGDGNNMANSWLEAAQLLGFELRIACPPGYGPDPGLVARTGGRARLVESPAEAMRGAQVVNTDVWASMGQEAEVEERRRVFRDYIVDRKGMALARPDAIVLHCLPAHRGEEIEEEVLEGPQSAVFDEAENRLHAQKALLEFLLAPR
ncbi:MAG TPA: ornithine carbamoyltransferase [Anaeromyxobacteraceae bacterium]|nr:ornithine carbamoyltransferase [Anaeromyxobacteraceae bacterium]